MENRDPNRKATADEILAAAFAVVVVFTPLVLIVVFPNNSVISALFGGGRLFVFWTVIFGLVFTFRRKIDKVGAAWTRRRNRQGD